MWPRVSPRLLEPGQAHEAVDCDFSRGRLEPMPSVGDTVHTVAQNTSTVYLWRIGGNEYWFQWDQDINVVRGPVAGDTISRTYFTGMDRPRYTYSPLGQAGGGPYPGASVWLGLPAPSSFSVSDPPGDPPEDAQPLFVTYRITFVTESGEEGPPSPVSQMVTRWEGESVGAPIITLPNPPSGNYPNFTHYRVYRQELSGTHQFIAELMISSSQFTDNVPSAEMGEALPTVGWLAPDQNMIGMTALPNGILAGFWENTVAFSEPYHPYAWPIEYRLALDYDIVGLAASTQGLVVATKGKPYLIAGAAPASMGQYKIEAVHPCLSKRSIVDMGHYVIYASEDGLVAVGGTEAQVVSEPHITQRQWRDRYFPQTIQAVRWRDYYLGFYQQGSNRKAFLFHPQEGFADISTGVRFACRDDPTGRVFVVPHNTNNLVEWEGAGFRTLEWSSKDIDVPDGRLFTAAKIDVGGSPSFTFRYLQDGVVVKTISGINSTRAFRVPALGRYRTAKIQVTGTGGWVDRIQLATSMSELI